MWPHEWDGCSWDLQRTYFDGFVAEGLITLNDQQGTAGDDGMLHRTVDTGAGVIDLQEMIRQSQAG